MDPVQWLSEFGRRLVALLRWRRMNRDLAEEMRSHQELRQRQEAEAGLAPDEARYAARRRFGNELQLRERSREAWGWRWLEDLLQDLRYGLRMLRKNPGFTITAVLTLALGIGANSAIFSVVNAVLLRPMPYPASDQLVYLIDSNPSHGWPRFSSAPANFTDWRAQNHSFEEVVAFAEDTSNVSVGDAPEQWSGLAATQGLFEALRVQPALGRAFTDANFIPGKEHILVLSDALWRRAFGADRSVIGRGIPIANDLYTIVGVMPPGFQFGGDRALYWTPFVFEPSLAVSRGAHFLRVLARLRQGVDVDAAQAEMKGIAAQLERQYPTTNSGWTVLVEPMRETTVRVVHRALLLLLGTVGFILLIACANAANMLLSRAIVRRREMAIRTALGAGRLRIVRQLLTESMVLAVAGGALGLVIALWSGRALAALPAQILPRAQSIHVDVRVLAFTFALALATGIIFGLAPALGVVRDAPAERLKESGPRGGGGRGGMQRLLVVTEVALAFALVAGSGLLIRSFLRLTSVQPGFQTEGRLTFRVDLPRNRYPTRAQQIAFFEQARQRLAALPGIQSVALTSLVPLNGDLSVWSFGVNGQPNQTSLPSATYYLVSPGYLRDMGIPLLAGREFTPQDTATAPHVCLINDFLARTIFPGRNPLGQRIQFGRNYDVVREIVGVVGSVKQEGLDTKDTFQAYEPLAQMPRPSMTFIVRTSGDPQALVSAARHVIRELDTQEPIIDPRTLGDYANASVALPRFRTVLLGLFAGLALVLALVGLYGVMSYTVAQQTQEIGIRMALGAQRRDIYGLVLRRGMLLVAAGVALGTTGAFGLTRFVASFLFGVTPHDPGTLAGVAVLFAGTSAVACWLPARRASRVDPLSALRWE